MHHLSLRLSVIFGSAWLLLGTAQVFGQETGDTENLTPELIRKVLHKRASDYVIKTAPDDTTLKRLDRSLLNWNNPQRTNECGIVQLWTDDGMPLVMASFFTFEFRGTREKHEFISLADSALVASYKDKVAWHPKEPGLKWNPLPAKISNGSRGTAGSKVRRLSQMRRFASHFKNQITSREGTDSELRFLTQPIYRFDSKKHKVLDGAIFSYSIGTDPEVLLILKTADGVQWDYALARLSSLDLRCQLDGQEIWKVDRIAELDFALFAQAPYNTYPYTTFFPPTGQLFVAE